MFLRSLTAALTGCALFVCGCASSRLGWPLPSVLSQQEVSTTGIAAQIARIEQRVASAEHSDEQEKDRLAEDLAAEFDQTNSPAVRLAIVRAWQRLPVTSSVDGLAAALQQEDPDLRMAACEALRHVRSRRALQLLTATARTDRDTDVRQAAIKALAHFPQPDAVATLAAALDDADPATQFVAVQSLKRVTGEDLGNDIRQWKQVAARHVQMASQGQTATQR